ncbi:acetyltransferase [Flavobacterium sp.]|uniref:acetyltransferase n=1 Tax=Flavobacterium sp. TaxID=239 RepID=UPI0025F89A7E|nr:acetyltransferase [Flavobacterium sp.]
MENSITLYGASGHGKVIIDILNAAGVKIKSVIDDNPKSASILDISITKTSEFDMFSLGKTIISIGNNRVRKKLSKSLRANFVKAIHPSANISLNAIIGEGTVVMAGVAINPDTIIGKHCIINTNATIEHDALIDDFVHICPGVSLAGNVTVGEGTQVGIAATVIQGLFIGKWATIGAGAVVVSNVPDYAVVVGNPGKIIKYNLTNE